MQQQGHSSLTLHCFHYYYYY